MTETPEDLQRFHNDPDYWWLRFRYALRGGRLSDAEEARQRLDALGISIQLHSTFQEALARVADDIDRSIAQRHEAQFQAIQQSEREWQETKKRLEREAAGQ
jgi:shikimate kinase